MRYFVVFVSALILVSCSSRRRTVNTHKAIAMTDTVSIVMGMTQEIYKGSNKVLEIHTIEYAPPSDTSSTKTPSIIRETFEKITERDSVTVSRSEDTALSSSSKAKEEIEEKKEEETVSETKNIVESWTNFIRALSGLLIIAFFIVFRNEFRSFFSCVRKLFS